MYIVNSYPQAVILCVITMICWGSWANTQKLASKNWGFPLFYWDYCLGLIIFSLVFGLTVGSYGENGQPFIENLMNASSQALLSALIGGVIFNIANLLLVAAIEIAGMAIAFPIGIGLALVLGVLVNYVATPVGNSLLIFAGVALVIIAIFLVAKAYIKISTKGTSTKGILLSLAAGILMGFFFRFVAASMTMEANIASSSLLSPYAAVFIFSIGVFLSSFIFNTYFMYQPISGEKVSFKDYFKLGSPKLHLIGIFGGIIWCLGMSLSLVASSKAGYAISYGLGQGATMVAVIWGVFIWKEFKNAPKGTNVMIGFMFLFFLAGLGLIISARFA